MDAPKVLHIVDDYYLGADKYNIILYKRGEVSGDGYRKAKPENIGKETYTQVGFYGSLAALANGLCKRYLVGGINDENVNTLKELAAMMGGFISRVEKIEGDCAALIAEKMEGTDDSTGEDNEEE